MRWSPERRRFCQRKLQTNETAARCQQAAHLRSPLGSQLQRNRTEEGVVVDNVKLAPTRVRRQIIVEEVCKKEVPRAPTNRPIRDRVLGRVFSLVLVQLVASVDCGLRHISTVSIVAVAGKQQDIVASPAAWHEGLFALHQFARLSRGADDVAFLVESVYQGRVW